jgi:glycosyltransferase involved in cell wall biosynthesis
LLSVIIPCYNSEKYVSRALESVLKQTYGDYEIILVDNNSSDGTVEILYDYEKKYPEKIKVLHEQTQGSPAARNKGLFEAKGEWIQFLDADDEIMENKIETQLSLVKDLKADVVAAASCRYKTLANGEVKHLPRQIETKDPWRGILTSKLGITSANLWRRKALLEVNGWNSDISSSQEYDLLFRLLKNNARIAFCPLVQTIVHVTENSISSSHRQERIIKIIDNSIKLRMDIKKYLKSKGLLTKELTRYADMYNYSTLIMINYKPLLPLFLRKGIIPEYVKKTLKENDFDVPFIFILKLYTRRFLNFAKDL